MDEPLDEIFATPPASSGWTPFPTAHLPWPLGDMTRRLSASIGVDPTFVALPGLAATSAAVGGLVRLRLNGTWSVRGALWCALVARASSGKTPASDAVFAPLYSLDAEQMEHDPDRPPLVVGDVTIERLGEILSQSPRGVIRVQDELAPMLKAMEGRYSNRSSGEREQYCSLWSSAPLRVHRKTSDDVYVRRPFLSVAGNLTPPGLRDLMEGIGTGFTPRWLMAYPPRPSNARKWNDVDERPECLDYWNECIHRLRREFVGDREFRLSRDAKEQWVDWYNGHESDLHARKDDDPALEMLGKGANQVARLALNFHALDVVGRRAGIPTMQDLDTVSARAMAQAIEVGSWCLREHERILLDFSGQATQDQIAGIVEWIRGQGGRVSPRQLKERGPSPRPRNSPEARTVLGELAQRGLGQFDGSVFVLGPLAA